MLLRSTYRLAAAAALLAITTITPQVAQANVQAGLLECRGPGSVSFLIGSVNGFDCIFRPTAGHPHRYVATIRRFGVDVGVSGPTYLTWAVFAPSRQVGYGALSGLYVGPSAGAALGVGLNANALIGGSGNSFALQPLSVAGQTGWNVAAGIAGLELAPAGRPAGRHYHYRRY